MADAVNSSFPLLDAATACPLCDAERPQPLHVYDNPKRRIARHERLILTGCRSCGVAWTHPLPSREELDAWYAGGAGWEQRPGLRTQAAGGAEAEAQLLRKLEAKRPARERETKMLLPLIAELPSRPGDEPPSVLDFGCGIGAWLDAFAARGWATTGIEPGPTARSLTARRHHVLEVTPNAPEFDLVLVQHVFEHLCDPLVAARALAAATRPGGWVFVSVPSFDRLPQHGKLSYVASGVHLFSYTGEGMRRMLHDAGLEVMHQLEGGGWEEGRQGPGVHLKVLARRTTATGTPTGEADPLEPARTALRAWGKGRSAALDEAPLPAPPRRLARLSRARRAGHQAALSKRKRALEEPLDLPLLDPPTVCPCCASAQLKPLHVQRNPRRRIAPVPHLVITGCRRCGIVFAHPLPTPTRVAAFYAGAEGWEDRLEEHADEREAFMSRKHERYRRELALLDGALGEAAGRGRRVMDFGCGLGAWLDVLSDAGWETEGLEPGAGQRAVTALRHRVVDAVPRAARYDLIMLNHVLEHLHDPMPTLRELRSAARPGARLYVSSPNLARLAEHGKLGYVTSGVHVMSFTAVGLRSMLGLAGWVADEALTGSGWDALDARPGMRLRMVAVAGEPVLPPPDPNALESAEAALRDHAVARATAQGAGSSWTSSFRSGLRAFRSESSSR